MLCACAVEAGLHFERKQVGVAEQAPLGVDAALDDAACDAVGGGEGAKGHGDHVLILAGGFAGEEGETGGVAEVDDDGAGAVFEAV